MRPRSRRGIAATSRQARPKRALASDMADSAGARTTPYGRLRGQRQFLTPALTGLTLFVVLGAYLSAHPRTAFDDAVRDWATASRSRAGVSLATLVSTAGSVTPMIVYALVVLIVVAYRRRSMVPLTAVAAPAAAVLAYLGTKSTFVRSRPSGVGNAFEGTYSFPSAHATTSSAVCCTVGYLLFRERLLSRAVAIAAAIIVPLVIGISRVYLDVHWATDVLGGWCLGVVIACAASLLYEAAGGPEAHAVVAPDRS